MTPESRKRVLKFIILPAVIILALIIGTAVFLRQPGNVTRQEAMEIALAHVGGGHANWPERDFEDFSRVWSVEVFYDSLVHEIYISRFTGEIVRVEIDR